MRERVAAAAKRSSYVTRPARSLRTDNAVARWTASSAREFGQSKVARHVEHRAVEVDQSDAAQHVQRAAARGVTHPRSSQCPEYLHPGDDAGHSIRPRGEPIVQDAGFGLTDLAELRLFLREPVTALFTLALPLMVPYVLNGVFGQGAGRHRTRTARRLPRLRRPDWYTPAYVAMAIAGSG